jgi:hypothetical protein
MVITTKLRYEALRSVNTATLAGTYVPFGLPLANRTYIFKIVNNSNQLLTISLDGVTDEDIIPPGSFILYDVESNKSLNADDLFLPQGTQFYVKGAAGVGLVYLVVLYGANI